MSADVERNALSAFFSVLAERAYKENDLSDVTYALLEANKAFRQFFLDFFFPNERLVGDQVVIEREHAVGEGRPDFWIRTGGEVYLVEVKIWDEGHHFEQYHEILKKFNLLNVYLGQGAVRTSEFFELFEQELREKKPLKVAYADVKECLKDLDTGSLIAGYYGHGVYKLQQGC